jgi:hypothetical protein
MWKLVMDINRLKSRLSVIQYVQCSIWEVPDSTFEQQTNWRVSSSGIRRVVATQRTTRRHIPEDDTLHNHRCENLKSYIAD